MPKLEAALLHIPINPLNQVSCSFMLRALIKFKVPDLDCSTGSLILHLQFLLVLFNSTIVQKCHTKTIDGSVSNILLLRYRIETKTTTKRLAQVPRVGFKKK
jgi:hypothetical protein